MSASTASNTVVTQLVETLRALAGSHPGFRAAHAKGIVCAGTFRPSADARRMTRAAHLQGGTVPTIVRFSRDERRLVFDPTNRTDGIELSNDPLLLARSAAYAISYERRNRGQ
jgi:catalase